LRLRGYARHVAGWDDVVRIGSALEGVEVSTWYGTDALKVGGKGFCRMRSDPDALVVMVDGLDEKEALLQGQPDVFFTTPHYDGYAFVLVRLKEIDPGQLEEVVEDAWRVRSGR
jgi:hypothetical protein